MLRYMAVSRFGVLMEIEEGGRGIGRRGIDDLLSVEDERGFIITQR